MLWQDTQAKETSGSKGLFGLTDLGYSPHGGEIKEAGA